MRTALARSYVPAPSGSVGDRLDAARRAVEGRFLQAGEVLAEAVDGLSRLIASLDQLGGDVLREILRGGSDVELVQREGDQVQGGGGLANAPFLIGHAEHANHVGLGGQ